MGEVNPVTFDINQATAALKALKTLRSNVSRVFQHIGDGLPASTAEESREAKFLSELQQYLQSIQGNLKEVEQHVSVLHPASANLQLGNVGILSHDSSSEVINLYHRLVETYKWSDKVHEYANPASTIFSQNTLKRSTLSLSLSAKRRRPQPSSHNVAPQVVDNIIAAINHAHAADMCLIVSRPYGTNAVLQVTLERVLKAVVVLKGLMVEWIQVKAFNEELHSEDGKLDLWSESRYKVFRKVTENANAAMLHFYSPLHPELALRSFVAWFRSYLTMFSDPCKKCGRYLHTLKPPTWRDMRTLVAYHEDCRP